MDFQDFAALESTIGNISIIKKDYNDIEPKEWDEIKSKIKDPYNTLMNNITKENKLITALVKIYCIDVFMKIKTKKNATDEFIVKLKSDIQNLTDQKKDMILKSDHDTQIGALSRTLTEKTQQLEKLQQARELSSGLLKEVIQNINQMTTAATT